MADKSEFERNHWRARYPGENRDFIDRALKSQKERRRPGAWFSDPAGDWQELELGLEHGGQKHVYQGYAKPVPYPARATANKLLAFARKHNIEGCFGVGIPQEDDSRITVLFVPEHEFSKVETLMKYEALERGYELLARSR